MDTSTPTNIVLSRHEKKDVKVIETEQGQVPVSGFSAGTAGTEIYSGYIQEEPLVELQGKKGADTYNKMRRSDGNIVMILRAIKLPIRSATWTIEKDDDSAEAKAQEELLKHILFKDLGKPWTRFTGEALTFVEFGHAEFEKTYKPVLNHEKFGHYIGVKSLGFRSQRTIERWIVDNNGNLLAVEQQSYGDTGRLVEIPSEHLIRFCPDQEGDNFEGISYLRPCYGAWFRKNLYLKLLAAGIEKYAIPVPILTIPSGKENTPEVATAELVLKKYTSNQTNYITVPEGWKIDVKDITLDPQKIREVIKDENQEMVNSVLASFLLLGQTGSGSYALGSTLGDFFGTSVQFLADHICEVMNNGLLTDLVKLNFGQELKCKLKVDGIKDSASASFADVIDKLIKSGAIKSDVDLEKFVREKFKLPVAKAIEVNKELPAGEEGEDVQKTALNGAQVVSLIQIVKETAQGLIPRASAVLMVEKSFNVSPVEADALIGEAGKTFLIAPPKEATPPAPSSPAPTQLSEGKPRQDRLIRKSANELRAFMECSLTYFGVAYIEKMRKAYQSSGGNSSKLAKIPNETSMPSSSDYEEILISISMIQAADAVAPIKASLKLAASTDEKLAKIKSMIEELNETVESFEATKSGQDALKIGYLQRSIKARLASVRNELGLSRDNIVAIKSRVGTLTGTQMADLKKKIDLQYQNSASSTDSEKTLFHDLEVARVEFNSSPVIHTGPDILASQNINESILRETEGEPDVESYTFVAVDDDVTSDICRELNGRTFGKDDPDLFRYHPPLHHNCRSYMAVNLKSFKGNPDITKEPLELSKGAQGSITLSEQTHEQIFGRKKALTRGEE